jgi:hypothetical protein
MEYEVMIGQLQTGATGFLGNLLGGVVAFAILVAIVMIGWYVAGLLGMVLRRFFAELKIEQFLQSHGVHDAFVGFTFTNIAVAMLKLYVVIFFLGIAASIVKVDMLTYFATQAMGYLPSLVQGLIILLVGLVAGDYITDRIKKHKTMPFANSVSILVELFIAYNALVIAMPMLLPAADPSLLVWSFLVVLGALAFALGLGAAIAIGLGMKDVVAEVAKKNKHHLHGLL